MDAIQEYLRNVLINSLPTFFLILILNFYLKRVFFEPVGNVLKERYNATEGARKLARESLVKAQAKDAEYESALRSARQDLIKEQEESRKSWRAAQSAQVESARAKAQLAVKSGKEQISSETAMARASLVEQTEALANQIASAVLRKTA